MGNQTTKVTGVIMQGDAAVRILYHQVVNLIDTTLKWLYQSTTSDDSIEINGNICLTEFIDNQLLTIVLLFYDIVEVCQFLRGMYDITDEDRGLVFEDGHLRGGRAWIDDEDLHIAARARE